MRGCSKTSRVQRELFARNLIWPAFTGEFNCFARGFLARVRVLVQVAQVVLAELRSGVFVPRSLVQLLMFVRRLINQPPLVTTVT
jgi:hypothetical protein